MTPQNFRTAIIGCGPHNETRGGCNSVSYAHATAITRTPGLKLAAAASRSRKNVDDFCAEHFHHDDTKPNIFYDRAAADIWHCFQQDLACRLDASDAIVGMKIILGIYASVSIGAPTFLSPASMNALGAVSDPIQDLG